MNDTYLAPYTFEFAHGGFKSPAPDYLYQRAGPVCWTVYRAPADLLTLGSLPWHAGRVPPYCGKVERGAVHLRCVARDGEVLRYFGQAWHTIPMFLGVLVDLDRAQLAGVDLDPLVSIEERLKGEWKGTRTPPGQK